MWVLCEYVGICPKMSSAGLDAAQSVYSFVCCVGLYVCYVVCTCVWWVCRYVCIYMGLYVCYVVCRYDL